MCGIFASYGNISEGALGAALETLRPRGPDGFGTWRSTSGGIAVALGHTRLSVMGGAGGAQPLVTADGSLAAVVNGEFYGYRELRFSLEARGHVFRTKTDSELVLHLYREYGDDFLTHLRGEFSLILWDASRYRLVAARDRFGAKPLCYGRLPDGAGGAVLFASQAKALLAAGVRASLCEESLCQVLSAHYLLPGTSLLAGVSEVLPGQVVTIEHGRLNFRQYWDLDYPAGDSAVGRGVNSLSEAEAVTELRFALEDSVRRRLVADVPVGFHLSGGLDSSAVVGIASRESASPLPCYIVSFGDESYDELAVARRTASHLSAELRVVRLSGIQMLEALEKAVISSEGLAINTHLAAKHLLNQRISGDGLKVILSGEGADENLFGYAHLLADFSSEYTGGAAGVMPQSNQNVVAGVHLPDGDGLSLSAVAAALGYVPTFLAAKASFGLKMRDVLSPAFRERLAPRDAYSRLLGRVDTLGQMSGRSRVEQSAYLWSKTALAGYILRTLGDGAEMAYGVEGRLPFLDHVLFETVRRIHPALKIKDGIEKYLLREAVRPFVTAEVYQRRKHPFMAPPSIPASLASVTAPASQELAFIMDHLGSADFRALPYFDHERLRNIAAGLSSMSAAERSAFDPVVMMALSVLFFKRGFAL